MRRDLDERGYNRLWAPEAYNLELDPKEQYNLAMQNLWLLAAALRPTFEYIYSVQKYGLILSGGDEPEIFDAEMPFYSPEALELAMGAMGAMGAIKKEAIKDMVKKKLSEVKQAITGGE